MNITLAVCCNCGFRVTIAGDGKHEGKAAVDYAQDHSTSFSHEVWIVKGTRTARAVPVTKRYEIAPTDPIWQKVKGGG